MRLIERKPGGLRNGVPFEAMPEVFKQLQTILLRKPVGDAVLARVSCAFPARGPDRLISDVSAQY